MHPLVAPSVTLTETPPFEAAFAFGFAPLHKLERAMGETLQSRSGVGPDWTDLQSVTEPHGYGAMLTA
ncbi:MAG: hypothetical protein I8H77_04310 [Comamonadaceae bacterium]|nr:hypothetical protein [Comamonadaceae bacterium]